VTGIDVIQEKLFTRDNISNIILKEEEIIRLRLSDYFGGSLNDYTYHINYVGPNDEIIDADKDMYKIVQMDNPYLPKMLVESATRNRLPLREMYVMLNEDEITSVDRTVLMIINEEYILEIVDFTYRVDKDYKVLATLNLLNVINTWFRGVHNGSDGNDNTTDGKNHNFKALSVDDLNCKYLAVVEFGRLYTVPCHTSQANGRFLLWILVYRNPQKYVINAFVHVTESILIDEIGANTLTGTVNVVKK
jgi:hypothetical protein